MAQMAAVNSSLKTLTFDRNVEGSRQHSIVYGRERANKAQRTHLEVNLDEFYGFTRGFVRPRGKKCSNVGLESDAGQ